ncbi:CHASE3 domain-containing protein [Gemmata sp. JC717]|uniref:sensor histidine kinase n=1 Tax=Gemmata algarum TaxID=2975278 RepID=UPI0021BA74F5|nr:CHASE3 domain-containing protein [Gemmata algarum]MDY3553807.1 CHASE3 domain-containing protein [Gemmata algarum]
MNLTVSQKGVALVLVPLAFQLVFVALVLKAQHDQVEAGRWAAHTKETIVQGHEVNSAVLDAHAAVRGYVISRSPAFAQPYQSARRELPARLEALSELVADNPGQQARVAAVRDRAEGLLAWLDAVAVLVASGKDAEAVERVRGGRGNEQADALRSEVALFLAEEERLDHERAVSLERARVRFNWLLATGGAAAVGFTAALILTFRRTITQRFATLEANARALGAGGTPAPLDGNDEIAHVDRALRAMATELSRASGALREMNEGLEQRVRERTIELEAANRDLAQKNTENEMFVYSVSHDLRSPLVNLQGFSKELEKAGQQLAAVLDDAAVPPDIRDRGKSVLGGKMAKSIGFIQTAVLRLSGIIDALLRLSRAGRVEYRLEAVDLTPVLTQVVAAAQGTIAERGATVQVAPLPPAWGDRTALGQAFANLIGNALTYLDPNRPGLIEVGCAAEPGPDGLHTYFVRDNGLGIAEGHQQKIFQAFQRAHPGVGSGEGLGLAIVARVAERHRGRAWVESRPGAGSTFFLALPPAPRASAKVKGG